MPRVLTVSLLLIALLAAASGPFVVRTGAQASRPVRHVVVFKYKPDATPAQIGKVTEAFRALATTIPGIIGFEDGVNDSPEGKNQGFTHVYLLTFESAAARDAYLPHPAHRKFGEVLRSSGIFVDAFVVDYAPHTTR